MAKIFIGKNCSQELVDKALDMSKDENFSITLHPMDELKNTSNDHTIKSTKSTRREK